MGFFDSVTSYTRSISLTGNVDERERARVQSIQDNVIFLNSVLALLTDLDRPFLHDEDLNNFLEFVNTSRPELQERAKTLKYIRANRENWFKDGSVQSKMKSVITIFEYLRTRDVLVNRAAECTGQEIDPNIVVQKMLSCPNFSMHDKNNPARKAWDELEKKTQAIFKPQDLYTLKH